MAENNEVPRLPGIRAISAFFQNFGGEDVVVRPAAREGRSFKIEVLLSEGKAVFPPAAPVHEGDTVERADPRGGVIEYTISRYEFSKDPFEHGNDHWNATLTEKGHAHRSFAQPNIVVHGGTNQISVGNANQLQQSNFTADAQRLVAALEEIARAAPRDDFTADHAEALDDAISDVKKTVSTTEKPNALK
ncbi:hypothetical protein AB4Y88_22735, partial [Paenarthrobacter sp. RAF9]